MKRTLVIGDIHGGLRALKQVFERAKVNESDKLIFLGDYVDGWSESAALISYLIETNEKYECVFIRGNHDIWCHDWLLGSEFDNRPWVISGGYETIDSYESINEVVKERHISFFQNLKDYYIDSENRLFVHAGFMSLKGPDNEVYKSNFYWDRSLWEMADSFHERIKKKPESMPKRLKLFNEIYIGHTPTQDYDSTIPINRINVWNLDTGAAFKGSLSIMDIDTKEFWQSDPLYSLYLNENGRNR